MLETGIPQCVWRGTKIMSRLYGEIEKEKDKFLEEPDTKYQSSLEERMPSTKTFSFKNASDYNLSDRLSLKSQFTFKNADNNLLLNEQLPSEVKFRTSSGINGVNTHFDSLAPNKDYRYTDPKFYQYRLNGMTQEKFMENQWRLQGNDVKTEDLDPTSKAIRQDKERVDDAANKIKGAYKTRSDQRAYQQSFESLQKNKTDKGRFDNLYNEQDEEDEENSKKLREKFKKNIVINKAKRKEAITKTQASNEKKSQAKLGVAITGNEDYKQLLQNVKDKAEMMQNKYKKVKTVKAGMNAEQQQYAKMSKRGKERKVAIAQEENRENEEKADEFRKHQLKKKSFENYKGKFNEFKDAQERGLVVGKKRITPGPTLKDIMNGPSISKSKGGTPANSARGRKALIEKGYSGGSSSGGSTETTPDSTFYTAHKEYIGTSGSNKSNSASVGISPTQKRRLEFDEEAVQAHPVPSVTAEEVKELATEYNRFIGSESNQSFIEANAEQILTAQQLLSNESGKAKDVLPEDVYATLKSIKILNINKATKAETVLTKINTLVEADKIIQKSQSPFKGGRRSTRKKGVGDEIPEMREQKERVVKNTVMPETMRAGAGGYGLSHIDV